MSNIFFYEPFYHLDRLLDEALAARRSGHGSQPQLHSHDAPSEGTVELFKPRYASTEFMNILGPKSTGSYILPF
jgi:hypothetical protein